MKVINKGNMFGIVCDENELKHIMVALGSSNNENRIGKFHRYEGCGDVPKPLKEPPFEKCEEVLRKYYEGN